MLNNTKITLEMTSLDVQLILPSLRDTYMKECTWGIQNPGKYPSRYGFLPISKKSKQILSIITHIEKQLNQQISK